MAHLFCQILSVAEQKAFPPTVSSNLLSVANPEFRGNPGPPLGCIPRNGQNLRPKKTWTSDGNGQHPPPLLCVIRSHKLKEGINRCANAGGQSHFSVETNPPQKNTAPPTERRALFVGSSSGIPPPFFRWPWWILLVGFF